MKKRKRKRKLSNHKLIWDNSTKEFHLVKSIDIQLATDDWVMNNDRRLGSKKSGQLIQIGAVLINGN